jgi:hypothetical protein
MKQRYGLLNKEKTEVIEWYTLGQKWLEGEPPLQNPKAEDFLAIGCLPEVIPNIPDGKKKGPEKIEIDKITYKVIDLTPEEIADRDALITKQEIREFKRSSPELLALLNDTDQNITDDINTETAGATNADIVAGIRTAQVKTRIMLRDLTIIVKTMVT